MKYYYIIKNIWLAESSSELTWKQKLITHLRDDSWGEDDW